PDGPLHSREEPGERQRAGAPAAQRGGALARWEPALRRRTAWDLGLEPGLIACAEHVYAEAELHWGRSQPQWEHTLCREPGDGHYPARREERAGAAGLEEPGPCALGR